MRWRRGHQFRRGVSLRPPFRRRSLDRDNLDTLLHDTDEYDDMVEDQGCFIVNIIEYNVEFCLL